MTHFFKTLNENVALVSRTEFTTQTSGVSPQTLSIFTFPNQATGANQATLEIHVTANDAMSSGANAAGFVINAILNVDGYAEGAGTANMQHQNLTLHMHNGDGLTWTAVLSAGSGTQDVKITVTGSTGLTVDWTVWTKTEFRRVG